MTALADSDLQPVGWGAAGLAVATAVLWAGQSLAVKVALDPLHGVQPFVSMVIRFGLAVVVLAAWALASRTALGIGRRAAMLVAANSVLLFTQIALYTIGTDWTTSVLSILLINTFPFFAALAAHWLVPEARLTAGKITGLALAFAGLAVTFGDKLFGSRVETAVSAPRSALGAALVVAAAAVVGLKIAFMKRVLREMKPQTMMFWDALLATPMFAAAALAVGETWPGDLAPATMAALAYQGLAVSGAAFILWTYLLSRHNPNDLTGFRLLTPPLGMLLGWWLLGEPLPPLVLLGAALIVFGIHRVTR